MDKIKEHYENNLDAYLGMLAHMVGINSFTANAQGVNEVAAYTAQCFSKLGFEAEQIPSENPDYGSHLFMYRKGNEGAVKSLVLISHLDTVFTPEEEIQNDFHWRVEGDRIYGPGTVDIKGGTVLIYMLLDALKTFKPELFNSINWTIAINASEEVLSDDFGLRVRERLNDQTLACLVFEGGTHSDKGFPIVVARKGRATFKVEVEGKSAHAGNNHAQGANAIHQISRTIQQIEALTDYARQITYNVGTVQGGVVVNRVPHFAEAHVEMRAFDPQIFETGCERILGLSGTSVIASTEGYACQVSVKMNEKTAPWPRQTDSDRLLDLWHTSAQSLGFSVIPEQRGGLSDGNMLWQHCPTLDGLGPTGGNAHCSERSADGSKDQEYALASSFIPKALINAGAVIALLEG